MKNGERAYGFNDTHREGEHEQNTIYMTLYEARFSEARRFRSRLRTAAARVGRGKEIRVGGAADLRISKTKKQDENGKARFAGKRRSLPVSRGNGANLSVSRTQVPSTLFTRMQMLWMNSSMWQSPRVVFQMPCNWLQKVEQRSLYITREVKSHG